MKKLLLFAILPIVLTSSLMAATATISIFNETKHKVTIMVGIVQGADAIPKNYRQVFQLDSGSQRDYIKTDLEKGNTISMYAVISKGGKTKPIEFYIDKKKYKDELHVSVEEGLVDDESSIDAIIGKYKNFQNIKTGYHEIINMGKEEVFKSIFGSMVVTTKDSMVIMRIPANSLKTSRADYVLTGESFNVTKDFKKESLIKLNGNVPLAADLSFMLGNSEIGSFKWDIKNAVSLPWSDKNNDNEITLFYRNIDSITQNYLADLYLIDSTIRLFFIDRIYLIENYNLKSYSFNKLTTDAEINVTIYGSATNNYVRSLESNLEVVRTNIVTDVWGSERKGLLKQLAENKLRKLQQVVAQASDRKVIEPVYNLLQEYNPNLPELNFYSVPVSKRITLDNIETIKSQINLK